MFLIVDNTRRKIKKQIQMKFNELNLPYIMTDLDHCDLYMPAAIIIVTERYLLEPVKYLAKMYDDSPVYLWDEETDFCEFAFNVYEECYGVKILEGKRRVIKIEEGRITCLNRRLRLTKTEQKIIYYLFYFEGYHLKEEIAKYCLQNGEKDMNSIPVHICNINNKSKRMTNHKIILMTRYKGYYI